MHNDVQGLVRVRCVRRVKERDEQGIEKEKAIKMKNEQKKSPESRIDEYVNMHTHTNTVLLTIG